MTWHIIINAERRILAVYGSALLDMAEQQQSELRKKYPLAVLDIETRDLVDRPCVGEIA